MAFSNARRALLLGPRPGRMAMRGISSWRGRPLVIIEEGQKALVAIDLERCLPPEEQITGVEIAARGITVAARFVERAVELELSGARRWYQADGADYDYGFDRADGVSVAIQTTYGDDVSLSLYVRAPSKPQDWRARSIGPTGNVTDLRRQPAYDEGKHIAVFPITGEGKGAATPSKPYIVNDFGPDFPEDFGS